jgi:formylmethanofuran dehydrogenase subunit E
VNPKRRREVLDSVPVGDRGAHEQHCDDSGTEASAHSGNVDGGEPLCERCLTTHHLPVHV